MNNQLLITDTSLPPMGITEFNASDPPYICTGAKIDTDVSQDLPYYYKDYTGVNIAPWLGQISENTFLNRNKLYNEPPVLTYRNIKLLYEPSHNYESVFNKNIEHFDNTQYVFKILILVFAMIVVYLLLYRKTF